MTSSVLLYSFVWNVVHMARRSNQMLPSETLECRNQLPDLLCSTDSIVQVSSQPIDQFSPISLSDSATLLGISPEMRGRIWARLTPYFNSRGNVAERLEETMAAENRLHDSEISPMDSQWASRAAHLSNLTGLSQLLDPASGLLLCTLESLSQPLDD
ncbi:hypothetical protein VTO42DRAFT_4219 [Malbranchea cinnamomea]